MPSSHPTPFRFYSSSSSPLSSVSPPSSTFSSSFAPSSSHTTTNVIYRTPFLRTQRGIVYVYLFLFFPLSLYLLSTLVLFPDESMALDWTETEKRSMTIGAVGLCLGTAAAFALMNRRTVREIAVVGSDLISSSGGGGGGSSGTGRASLAVGRRLRVTTVGVWRSSEYFHDLDCVLPPFAWGGSDYPMVCRLKIVESGANGGKGGVKSYWLFPAPNKVLEHKQMQFDNLVKYNRFQQH
jgi:hypothetical protein